MYRWCTSILANQKTSLASREVLEYIYIAHNHLKCRALFILQRCARFRLASSQVFRIFLRMTLEGSPRACPASQQSSIDAPHCLIVPTQIVDLPWKVQVSVLSSYLSHPAVAPVINGFDNTGTNYSSGGYTLLLALVGQGSQKYADFLSKEDLQNLVNQYNATFAGTLTPAGKAGFVANQNDHLADAFGWSL